MIAHSWAITAEDRGLVAIRCTRCALTMTTKHCFNCKSLTVECKKECPNRVEVSQQCLQFPAEWAPLNFNVTMAVALPSPVWVIKTPKVGKRPEGYMRIPTSGGYICVADKRFATRFDSALWAETVARVMKGSRVVRLWTKSEREAHKAREIKASVSTIWAKKKPEKGEQKEQAKKETP